MRYLLLLCLVMPAFGQQAFHLQTNVVQVLQTNVVQVSCKSFCYYGVKRGGGVTYLGTVEDHNASGFESGPFREAQFDYVFRTETPVELAIIWQAPKKQPVMLPPMPPIPMTQSNNITRN